MFCVFREKLTYQLHYNSFLEKMPQKTCLCLCESNPLTTLYCYTHAVLLITSVQLNEIFISQCGKVYYLIRTFTTISFNRICCSLCLYSVIKIKFLYSILLPLRLKSLCRSDETFNGFKYRNQQMLMCSVVMLLESPVDELLDKLKFRPDSDKISGLRVKSRDRQLQQDLSSGDHEFLYIVIFWFGRSDRLTLPPCQQNHSNNIITKSLKKNNNMKGSFAINSLH